MVEKGPKNSGPPFSGNARRKNFFLAFFYLSIKSYKGQCSLFFFYREKVIPVVIYWEGMAISCWKNIQQQMNSQEQRPSFESEMIISRKGFFVCYILYMISPTETGNFTELLAFMQGCIIVCKWKYLYSTAAKKYSMNIWKCFQDYNWMEWSWAILKC